MGCTLNGKCLEFIEDGHIYLVDGVIVPSVSDVIEARFGNKYRIVDPAVLKRAADRGTRIHDAIERYCKTGEEEPIDELHNFLFLQKKYEFDVVANELPVIIEHDGLTIAGRLDMVIMMNGRLGGVDIKSTSVFDRERTALQLNLYRIGFAQCYGEEWDFIAGIHLRGDTRRFIDLPVDQEFTEDILKEYKNERCCDDRQNH